MSENINDQVVVKYIKTKNKIRKIVTYKDNCELRVYHQAVLDFLKENTSDSIFAKAYVPKSSIYRNAEAHMYNDIFVKMDIERFFPSLNHNYLSERLYYEINKTTEISRRECYEIVEKCSVSDKGLPLGFVTSPALANMYMKEFDGILYGKIKRLNVVNPIYTRYADDMVISFKYTEDFREIVDVIKKEVGILLKRFYLKVNNRKTAVVNLLETNQMRITGICITRDSNNYRSISVGKKLKNKIFWDALNLYDNQEKKNDYQVAHLKGILSFVLSIEKNGIDGAYSEGMQELLKKRGFNGIKELVDAL